MFTIIVELEMCDVWSAPFHHYDSQICETCVIRNKNPFVLKYAPSYQISKWLCHVLTCYKEVDIAVCNFNILTLIGLEN
jgi:hypothetical protein